MSKLIDSVLLAPRHVIRKSYMANALCISALRQFKTVKYIRASHLIDELNRAESLGTYWECLAQMPVLPVSSIVLIVLK